MPKLTKTIATVELADGRLITTRITLRDKIRYEETARRLGWPGPELTDGTVTMNGTERQTAYHAFASLTRTGKYSGSWENFLSKDCVDVASEEMDADPTQPAPPVDSSQSSPGTDADPSTSSPQLTTT